LLEEQDHSKKSGSPKQVWKQEDSHCSSGRSLHVELIKIPAVTKATGPSVGAVAEAGARAPWPVEATTVATAQVVQVVAIKAVVPGAVGSATAIVQGRAQGHNAVEGGGPEGPVEVGSIARIAWEVASTAEITSHGGKC
jgi:hypothetical protein